MWPAAVVHPLTALGNGRSAKPRWVSWQRQGNVGEWSMVDLVACVEVNSASWHLNSKHITCWISSGQCLWKCKAACRTMEAAAAACDSAVHDRNRSTVKNFEATEHVQ